MLCNATREINKIWNNIFLSISYIDRDTIERSAILSSTFAAYAQEDDGDKRDTASAGFGVRSFPHDSSWYEPESWTQKRSRLRQVDRI